MADLQRRSSLETMTASALPSLRSNLEPHCIISPSLHKASLLPVVSAHS